MQVTIGEIAEATSQSLRLTWTAGREGAARMVGHPRIQRTGLAIAGLLSALRPDRIHVLGKSELDYLEQQSLQQQNHALNALLCASIPALIVTRNQAAPPALIAACDAHQVPLFISRLGTSALVSKLHQYLFEHLSPQTTLHAVHLDVFGVGVVLTGQSGIGKSECALDLILRGHRLIADDSVVVRRRDNSLIGSSAPFTKHHMEVRGLGIINVKDLFGTASVCDHKELELFVEMAEWHAGGDYDRLGLDDAFVRIFDVPVAKVRLPISPGRNVAPIVEVAARNYLLKAHGHHAARRFADRVHLHLDGLKGRTEDKP